ncbi:MAG: DedA family protein [Gemmatimonadetes bacterium]|nr:DedA family protein [Gemmatimonadota bacterium]
MELLKDFIDLFLHLDKHLNELIGQYGTWTYAILWLIVFCETGLVVTPFLPGDSLLFAAGTFAGMGTLNPWLLFVLLTVAAILGDTVNYWIGKKIGPRAFTGTVPFLNQAHLRKTEAFYEKHGAITIIVARFVPIVRTFAPFVAGVGSMNYGRFLAYNVAGGVLWVGLFIFGGYLFGNIPVVRQNFGLVVIAIIVVSVMPVVIEWVRARREGAGAV